ncbi:MAG: UDP-glucose/GDP-mannose dehydrogenase family protein [Calditrichaeota bacterium]|nr:UDP-glucose/GDP-mannose dehydrogenase family protein [Calditrichota bacterium]
MKISVFGLGYVGCVSAACLAKVGHEVIGVDVNQVKVNLMNAGKSPIVEKDIGEILHNAVKSDLYAPGKLQATTDTVRAVLESEISLICVGTPSNENGSLKLDYVKRCAFDIGLALAKKTDYHVVVARSTMLPGSVEDVILKELEAASGKQAGVDFGVAMNPEFLRESTSVYDFYHPPMTVIGQYDEKSGNMLEKMYHFLDAPLEKTDIKTAEMMKYACNCFHAAKVTFANEIGGICKSIGVDSHKVMEIFCMDDKLNLSSYYLKPGFAFGGSCLPKDLRALNYKAKSNDVDVPLLASIITSNKVQIDRVIRKIVQTGIKKVGFIGLSFKAGTDDLRESPLVILVESLIGKGFDIKIFDRNVSLARLVGANKDYIEKEIPHISKLMTSEIDDIVQHSDLIVIGNKAEEATQILKQISDETKIYDLVRVSKSLDKLSTGYEGICW